MMILAFSLRDPSMISSQTRSALYNTSLRFASARNRNARFLSSSGDGADGGGRSDVCEEVRAEEEGDDDGECDEWD